MTKIKFSYIAPLGIIPAVVYNKYVRPEILAQEKKSQDKIDQKLYKEHTINHQKYKSLR